MATETIDSLREKHVAEIDAKLADLKPAYDEYNDLNAYRESIGGKPRARTSTRSNGGSRAGVDRKADVEAYLKEHPGVTIPELSKALTTSANYLYRVRDTLEEEDKLVKVDNKLYLTADAPKPE